MPGTLYKSNRLTLAQATRLTDQLRADSARIITQRPTKNQLALEYSQLLGFKVTEANVEHVSESINIRWVAKQVRKPLSAEDKQKRTNSFMSINSQLTYLTGEIEKLKARFSI